MDKKEYSKEYREKERERNKIYRENNIEKVKERGKIYYENNIEKVKEKKKIYYQENKEKVKERKKIYSQTENGKKSKRITNWKSIGVIHNDFDTLYDYYINCKNCENCDVELEEGRKTNSRCLDHSHKTGFFRNVLCNTCNIKRQEDNF